MNNQQPLQSNIPQQSQKPDFQPETSQKPNLPVWAIVLIAVLSVIVVGGIGYGAYWHFCPNIIDACPEIYIPVCGVDGQTYSNDCFAELAGVEVDYQGECQEGTEPIACPMDAKICPDGSSVGRIPPDCEFAPCPEVVDSTAEIKEFIDNYLDAYIAQDFVKLRNYLTSSAKDQFSETAASLISGDIYKILNIVKSGLGQYTVEVEIIRGGRILKQPNGDNPKFIIIKENNKWKTLTWYLFP